MGVYVCISQLKQIIMKFKKYKTSLCLVYWKDFIYVESCGTHVATIVGDKIIQLGWWSATTQKHINYVASELKLIKYVN